MEMELKTLVASLPSLKRELEAATRRAADAQQEVSALEEIIRGIEKLTTGGQLTIAAPTANAIAAGTPVEVITTVGRPLRGADAVRTLMADGRPWRQQALIAEIKRRGWVKPGSRNPDSAIREVVRRLAKAGEVERVEHATYRLVRKDDE